jgi:hypothetical protein
MTESGNFDYWELPATIFLVDTRYDRETFEMLISKLSEELEQIDALDFDVLKHKVNEHFQYARNAFESDTQFLLMFCWAPTYRTFLPSVTNTFKDHEIEKIRQVVQVLASAIINFKCNGFELKYLNDNNPLLFFALENCLLLELARLNHEAAMAKDRGYDA